MRLFPTTTIALVPLVTASQLVWPTKWDEMENLSVVLAAVVTCPFGSNVHGRQNAAEWIRTAFHDMITHDAAAGTGGLDASIFWELKRPENPGSAFDNTFSFLSAFYNTRASVSDLVALGVVVATGGCDGPRIPFRAGRIDANAPGAAGVPEPHTNLADTLAAFTKAGFNNQDMVAMVACGHALGGVHSVDFPDVTGIHGSPDNDTLVPFQKDVSQFQNGVVTEFLSGESVNPLVVASNDTLNSDKRIFNSDRATMDKLATTSGFNSMCADIFTRMIDTVPKSVTLTDIIEPYDVKPYIQELSLDPEGHLHFKGFIRFATTKGSGRNPDDLAVELMYADRSGKGKVAVPATRAIWHHGITSGLSGNLFVSFEFDTTIQSSSGISKFWIQETVPSTKATRIHDNQNTGGYKVDDTVLYQRPQSCLKSDASDESLMLVNAMLRADYASAPLTLRTTYPVGQQGSAVPWLKTMITEFEATGNRSQGWIAYKAQTKVRGQFNRFDIALGGSKPAVVEFLNTGAMPATCS